MFWRPILGGSLKSCGSDESKPFTTQRESGSYEFLSSCVSLCHGWGLWWDCVSASTHFNVVFFSFWCGVVAQLVSKFLSYLIVSYITIDLLCPWEEVSSRASYVTILTWNQQFLKDLKYTYYIIQPFHS